MKKLLLAVVLVALVSVFYLNKTFYMIENNLTDKLTTDVRKVDPRIKILAVDDVSLDKIGRWPWPRHILAETADKLAGAGAKAIWPDILYTEKSENPAEDEAWTEVLRQHNNVYLPAYAQFEAKQADETKLTVKNMEWPVMAMSRDQIGHINVIEDRDKVVRKAMLGIATSDGMLASIDVRLANAVLPKESQVSWNDSEKWSVSGNVIPTDVRNQVLFSYASSPKQPQFETIPIWQVIEGKIPPSYFKDSIVMIGPHTVGLQDAFYTPTHKSQQMFGVDIHANIVQALLDDAFYTQASSLTGLIIVIILTLLTYLVVERVKAKWGVLIFALLLIGYTVLVIVLFSIQRVQLPYFYPLAGMAVAYVASVVSQYLRERRERNRVTGIFGRYVSKGVVDTILSSKEEIQLGGVRKDVTLMFVDIRGFTPLSEKMEPEDVIRILNEYLDLCTKAIFAFGGTLDKFIGDGVMSMFGAPMEQPDHAERAVRAALQMKEGAGQLSERIKEKYGRGVSFGMGINSGPAVVGNIGSQERLDYTAIGDTVNLAARLESNAKGGQILISRGTYERVKERFEITSLDAIKVKGKENLVEIFEVTGVRTEGGETINVAPAVPGVPEPFAEGS